VGLESILRPWNPDIKTTGNGTVKNKLGSDVVLFYCTQDNPPLRSGIPEMKGAANFTLDMVRVVGGKDHLRMEGNLRDFHRIFWT
jgi:hypothetical protein